jgi:hypothetical protein
VTGSDRQIRVFRGVQTSITGQPNKLDVQNFPTKFNIKPVAMKKGATAASATTDPDTWTTEMDIALLQAICRKRPVGMPHRVASGKRNLIIH